MSLSSMLSEIKRIEALVEWKIIVSSDREMDVSKGSGTTKAIKETAAELGIRVEELADGSYELKKDDIIRRIGKGPTFDIDNAFARMLCSNKYATFEILRKYGFQYLPHYGRYSLYTIEEARRDFLMRGKPVVIKPSSGTSGGKGVTVNIQNIKELNRAIYNSLRYNTNFQMEDFIEGDSFRILLFKERILDAVQRIPANVKGDGKNNLENLIRIENDRRVKDQGYMAPFPINIDNDLKQTLRNKRISLKYFPKKDEIVYVKTISNHHAGGDLKNVMNIVHPDVVKACKDIMRIMDIGLGGIDLITKDIGRPLAETGGVINEVNTGPGLDLHEKDVVKNVLNLIFEEK